MYIAPSCRGCLVYCLMSLEFFVDGSNDYNIYTSDKFSSDLLTLNVTQRERENLSLKINSIFDFYKYFFIFYLPLSL